MFTMEFRLKAGTGASQTITDQEQAKQYLVAQKAHVMATIARSDMLGLVARVLHLRLAEQAVAAGKSYDLTELPVPIEDAMLYIMEGKP